jgi:hypothetical protein
MYFYINSTLALFGYHQENEAFGAINVLLDTPKGDGLAMKMWYAGRPAMKQSTSSFGNHMRVTDLARQSKFKNYYLCTHKSLTNLFYKLGMAGEALHTGSCFLSPKHHKFLQPAVQCIEDVIYNPSGAPHQGSGLVGTYLRSVCSY